MDSGAGRLDGAWLRAIQLAVVVLVALKLGHWIFAGVFMDEAYYWMWGQHPALSYYDHPPLNAWLLGLSSWVFGWSKLALRAPVVLSFAADTVALYLISRRLGGDWRGHFWVTLLLFLATPVFSMVTNYALPDHLLLPALLFAIYFFLRFFQDRAAGLEGRTRDLLAGALCLGLGGLAKYNAAFLGIGVAAFVLLHDRALLLQLRLYVAAMLAVLMQLPVIVWNVGNRFASYGFILEGRHAGLEASLDGLPPLLLGVLVFISPFLLWPALRFAVSRTGAKRGTGFAQATFWVSTVAVVALSLTTLTLFHWNLAAYAAMLPFVAAFTRPVWVALLQGVWGIGFALVALVSFAFVPLNNAIGWRDQSIAWSYDWSAVAAAIETARAEEGAGFVAAADYTTASLVGFALKDRDVASLTARRDQFDYWFDAQAHRGETAILYSDRWRPIPASVQRRFASMEVFARIPVRDATGTTIYTQFVYVAKDYQPGD